MTSYNDLNTGRVKVKVRTHGVPHVTLGRFVSGGGLAQAREVEEKIFNAYLLLEPELPTDFACLGVSWAAGGSNVFLDITPDTAWASITGGRIVARRDAAKNLKISGKDLGGNTTSISLWGTDEAGEQFASDDYRRTPDEGSIVNDILGALVDPAPVLVGRSGQILSFKSYLNIGLSAYWQKELRKG